jgi:hypothetical protein
MAWCLNKHTRSLHGTVSFYSGWPYLKNGLFAGTASLNNRSNSDTFPFLSHSCFLLLILPSFFLNRPLLPCGVEGFLLVNLLDNW